MVSLGENKGVGNSALSCLWSCLGMASALYFCWYELLPVLHKFNLLIQSIDSPLRVRLPPVGSWITSVPRCLPQVSHQHTCSFQYRGVRHSGSPATMDVFPLLEPQMKTMQTVLFFLSLFCLLISQSVSPTRFWQHLFAVFPSVPWVTGDWCQVRKWNVNFIKHPLSSLRINPDSGPT